MTGPPVPEDIYLIYTSAIAINSTAVLFVGANIPYGCCHKIFINSARVLDYHLLKSFIFLEDLGENYWYNYNNEYKQHHTILFNFKSNKWVINLPKLQLNWNFQSKCNIFAPISTTIFHDKDGDKYVCSKT